MAHKREQNEDEDEVNHERALANLKEQLRIVQMLPGDFRDINPGSKEWKMYKKHVPQASEAMDQWRKGPVMCFGREITMSERELLKRGHSTVLSCVVEPNACTMDALVAAVQNAEAAGASYMYMKGFPMSITRAINWMASFFKLKIRAIHEFTEETHKEKEADHV